jgi:DNA ligase (NAD+)
VDTPCIKVKYNVSKDAFLKPTVYVKPIALNGVTISKATGFNAAFIRDNKIGPGAIVTISRRGDVIPHIELPIIKPAAKAQMPSEAEFGPWHFNSTDVDAVLEDHDNDALAIRRLRHFFSTLKIANFSKGLITKFYDAGYTTIPDILHLSAKQMVKTMPGVQITLATKIVKNFQKLHGVSMPSLMDASGFFGRSFGTDRLKLIYNKYKEDAIYGWTGKSLSEVAQEVGQIHGLSEKSGRDFAKGIKPFLRFLQDTKDVITPEKFKAVRIDGSKMKGLYVCFSGVRDRELSEYINSQGGIASDKWHKETNVLLVSNIGMEPSIKMKKAKDSNIPIMTVQSFKKKYGIK